MFMENSIQNPRKFKLKLYKDEFCSHRQFISFFLDPQYIFDDEDQWYGQLDVDLQMEGEFSFGDKYFVGRIVYMSFIILISDRISRIRKMDTGSPFLLQRKILHHKTLLVKNECIEVKFPKRSCQSNQVRLCRVNEHF